MADDDDSNENHDRSAILARRSRLIDTLLAPLDGPALAGPKTKLMAVAVSGLATACPCLSIYVPEETSDTGGTGTGESGDTGETGTETETETGTDTETGETGMDMETGTESETGETAS